MRIGVNLQGCKVGDKLYKKKDETIIYEITEIWEEEDGNWHDGYKKLLYVRMECEIDIYLLAIHILGSGICIYCVKTI